MNVQRCIRQAAEFNRCGQFGEAETLCTEILVTDPHNIDALHMLGELRHRQGRELEAQVLLQATLKLDTDPAEAWSKYGRTLQAIGKNEDAFAAYQKAVATEPTSANAFYYRGKTLLRLNRAEEALASFDTAKAMQPNNASVICGRGQALHTLNRLQEALSAYREAIALQPDLPEAHYRMALAHLRLCEFLQGWPAYEWRWHRRDSGSARFFQYNRRWSQWTGEAVRGTLFLWAEQGIGEEIMFSSMVPDLVDHANRTVLEVEPRLVGLFKRSFAKVSVCARSTSHDSEPITAHAPLGSLGQFLRPSFTSFPVRERGYLVAEPGRTQSLRSRLSPNGETVVGLSWQSSARASGIFKSASLVDFEPLLRLPGCRFVDLQYGDTRPERERIARELGVTVERVDDIDNYNDIDGLAALMAACDVVVSVSSANAHLAGALGKPAWVLVPSGRGRLWFWFQDRHDSPWYPHVRVHYQSNSRSWMELATTIALEVAKSIEEKFKPRTFPCIAST